MMTPAETTSVSISIDVPNHYNKLDKGGHFAAWEQPKLFVDEVRAGFRWLRNAV